MDPTLILLVLFLGAFIVFQIFQGRKRRRETENRQTLFVPGVEIMTNYGLYGTILSIDDDKNLAVIETTPGVQLKIHRQTILKIADYDTPVADETADAEADVAAQDDDDRPQLNTDTAIRHDAEPGQNAASDDASPRFTEPRYGELRDDPKNPSRSTDKTGDQ